MGQTSSGLPTIGEVPNDAVDSSFTGLGGDFDDLATVDVGADMPATLPVQTPAVAAPAPAAPVVQPPVAPAAPAIAQPAQPVAAPQPQPSASPAQPADLDGVIGQLQSDMGNIVKTITPAFALSQEQLTALETDAQAAIPELLAQVYVRAVTTNLQYMKQLIPNMIDRHAHEQSIHRESEKEFFSLYPQLDRGKHGDDIVQYANAVAAANPGITKQALFEIVGNAVMAKNGITKAPPTVKRVTQPAFSPAGHSAPQVAQTPQAEVSPFQGLGMDFDG